MTTPPAEGTARDLVPAFPWMFPNRSKRLASGSAVLALILWLSVRTSSPTTSTATVQEVAGLSLAGLGWLAWTLVGSSRTVRITTLAAIAIGGGVASSPGPAGLLFVAGAATGAAISLELPYALGVGALGPLAFLVATAATGSLPGRLAVVGLVAMVGLLGGSVRRQYFDRARQSALVALADERSEVASREAALVAERNRLGRELHDVLAHTLGALSVQLSALEALLDADADPSTLRPEVERSHRLVDEGLNEAHQAVRALRENRRPLCEELAELCSRHHASFAVSGEPTPAGAEASLALYRVAQEAITNATKHAPGSPITVEAAYGPESMSLTVSNPVGEGPPPSTKPGGFGLVGMRERLQLVGGSCDAGRDGDQWRVTAAVPL